MPGTIETANETLTARAVAAYLGTTLGFCYELLRVGRISAHIGNDGQWHVDAGSARAYKQARDEKAARFAVKRAEREAHAAEVERSNREAAAENERFWASVAALRAEDENA